MITRPRGTDSAKLVTLIETTALAGTGTRDDPLYVRHQYWTPNGELIAEGYGKDLITLRDKLGLKVFDERLPSPPQSQQFPEASDPDRA